MKTFPIPVPFAKIQIGGELARRAMRNFDRLEQPEYQPGKVFQAAGYDWPGDTEGRIVLALGLLAQATQREPKYLGEILASFPKHLNGKGYFGGELLPGAISEQQLSSHGWVLRGLCEEYRRTGHVDTRRMIETIIDNLVLPTAGRHRDYPIDPALRLQDCPSTPEIGGLMFEHLLRSLDGGYVRTTVECFQGWALSTDIGCNFILLDGVVQAWELTGRTDLIVLIEEIIKRFLEMDLVMIRAQAHATLTALRAILRYAGLVERPELIAAAEARYGLYLNQATTANFANFNWFERPEWTEACAVIDSFMVAVQLWQLTQKPEYLTNAHLIYFNAFGHAQRWNGGFGCDTCAGVESPFLRISTPEVYWCCTMRGAEGLASAVQSSYFTHGNTVYVPFFHDSSVALAMDGSTLHLEQSTGYPHEGHVRLEVLKPTTMNAMVRLCLFHSPWAGNARLTFNGQPQAIVIQEGFIELASKFVAGDVIDYRFELALERVRWDGGRLPHGYTRFRHGPLLLACESGEERGGDEEPVPLGKGARYRFKDGTLLEPINDVLDRDDLDMKTYRRQVLFKTAQQTSV